MEQYHAWKPHLRSYSTPIRLNCVLVCWVFSLLLIAIGILSPTEVNKYQQQAGGPEVYKKGR